MLTVDFVKAMPDFNLNIKFETGQGITALFGPSGSGKSLTLKCIAGLLTPDEGQIRLNDTVFFDRNLGVNLPAQKRGVGYVFQNYALFPHLTVYNNIAYGIKHLPKEVQQEKISRLLVQMRLQGLEHKKPENLSGGQQQRVALARALAVEPKLLLLDEPFSALDSAVRSKLRGELLDLLQQNPVPTLLVTHSLDEAYSLSTHMAVIESGKVIQFADKETVLTKPANKRAARLTRAKNIFTGIVHSIEGQLAKISTHDFPVFVYGPELKKGQEVTVVIRPHQLKIAENRGQLPRHNVFKCVITKIVNHADSHTLYLRLEANMEKDYHFLAKVTDPPYSKTRLENSSEVFCCLPPEEIFIIAGA